MASATFARCCMCSGWLVPSHTARWASGIEETSRSCARRIGDPADRLPAERTVVGTARSLPAAISFARAVPSRARCLAQRALSVRNRRSVYTASARCWPGLIDTPRRSRCAWQPPSVGRAGRRPRRTSRSEPSASAPAAGSVGSSAVPNLTFTRLNEAWLPAARLAQLLLRADSVRDATGPVAAISFTVDMNKLFERFVETVVDEEARLQGWELQAQGKRRLTDSVMMQPDFIVRRGGVDCAVGDANTSVLRLVSGARRPLSAPRILRGAASVRGLLIYAETGTPRSERVDEAGTTMDVIGVDPAATPRAVLAETRQAARHLIRHAQDQLDQQLRAA